MAEAQTKSPAPWHLWAVGVVAALWNGYGCYDYIMTNTGGVAYLRAAGLSEDLIAYYMAMPAWMTAAWAVGVWGGLAGAALLLLRRKWALYAFAASLAAVLLSQVYYYLLSEGAQAVTDETAVINAVIVVGAILFAGYSWFAARRGVLR